MMISLIGNNNQKARSNGFTFFEVMVTIAVLAVGIVMIYKSFLITLDYQRHLTNRLYAMNLLNHEIAVVQRIYQETGIIPFTPAGKKYETVLNNKQTLFDLALKFKDVDNLENISQLDLILSWKEAGRQFRVSRTAYIARWE